MALGPMPETCSGSLRDVDAATSILHRLPAPAVAPRSDEKTMLRPSSVQARPVMTLSIEGESTWFTTSRGNDVNVRRVARERARERQRSAVR